MTDLSTNAPLCTCAAIDLVGRLTAVAWVGEDVVDDQRTTGAYPFRPAVEVLLCGGLAVATVDEQQLQRRAPPAGHHGRLAHHRHHVVVQAGVVERPPQGGQGIETSGGLVDQRRVVVLPPGLMFFGAVVVVDGIENAVTGARRRA